MVTRLEHGKNIEVYREDQNLSMPHQFYYVHYAVFHVKVQSLVYLTCYFNNLLVVKVDIRVNDFFSFPREYNFLNWF